MNHSDNLDPTNKGLLLPRNDATYDKLFHIPTPGKNDANTRTMKKSKKKPKTKKKNRTEALYFPSILHQHEPNGIESEHVHGQRKRMYRARRRLYNQQVSATIKVQVRTRRLPTPEQQSSFSSDDPLLPLLSTSSALDEQNLETQISASLRYAKVLMVIQFTLAKYALRWRQDTLHRAFQMWHTRSNFTAARLLIVAFSGSKIEINDDASEPKTDDNMKRTSAARTLQRWFRTLARRRRASRQLEEQDECVEDSSVPAEVLDDSISPKLELMIDDHRAAEAAKARRMKLDELLLQLKHEIARATRHHWFSAGPPFPLALAQVLPDELKDDDHRHIQQALASVTKIIREVIDPAAKAKRAIARERRWNECWAPRAQLSLLRREFHQAQVKKDMEVRTQVEQMRHLWQELQAEEKRRSELSREDQASKRWRQQDQFLIQKQLALERIQQTLTLKKKRQQSETPVGIRRSSYSTTTMRVDIPGVGLVHVSIEPRVNWTSKTHVCALEIEMHLEVPTLEAGVVVHYSARGTNYRSHLRRQEHQNPHGPGDTYLRTFLSKNLPCSTSSIQTLRQFHCHVRNSNQQVTPKASENENENERWYLCSAHRKSMWIHIVVFPVAGERMRPIFVSFSVLEIARSIFSSSREWSMLLPKHTLTLLRWTMGQLEINARDELVLVPGALSRLELEHLLLRHGANPSQGGSSPASATSGLLPTLLHTTWQRLMAQVEPPTGTNNVPLECP